MMKRSKRFAALILTGVMAVTTLFGCGSSSGGAASDSSAADSSSKKVLKVGMECAYAPFNWTQDTDTTPDGSKAVKIAGSDYYAYGYDVAVAQKRHTHSQSLITIETTVSLLRRAASIQM